MSNRKSEHAKESRKEKILAITRKLETKGNHTNSAAEMTKDLIVGGVAGAVGGLAIGKSSVLLGLGTSLIGHYYESSLATSLGVGLMTSGIQQIGQGTTSGTSGLNGIDEAKERVKNFGNNFKQFFAEKFKSKSKAESTNGIGSVKYFKYPQEKTQELDMSALEHIENQIAKSGEQYQKQMAGTYDDLSGADDKLY